MGKITEIMWGLVEHLQLTTRGHPKECGCWSCNKLREIMMGNKSNKEEK